MAQVPTTFSETYTPDALIAGEVALATRSYVLISGQNLPRGAVVGVITTSGKLTLSTSAASDGSQTPMGILADSYDASGGDVGNCAVYLRGDFNENAISLGTGWTIGTVFAPLRSVGIFLKPVVAQSGAYV